MTACIPTTLNDLKLLSETAAASPRLRRNLNLHRDDAAACHRLFNAVEPGSYITPHRHQDPGKDETMLAVAGELLILMFDGGGRVVEHHILAPSGPVLAATIPAGTFHTLTALQPGSIFFEAKAGPYRPLSEDEYAPWAPREGEAGAESWLASLLADIRR